MLVAASNANATALAYSHIAYWDADRYEISVLQVESSITQALPSPQSSDDDDALFADVMGL